MPDSYGPACGHTYGGSTIGSQRQTLTALCDALDSGSISVAELRVITALASGGMTLDDAVAMVKDAANGVIGRSL